MDPYSWGWVAEKLAEGMVSYVGGKLLGSILGEPNQKHLIQDAVDELKHYISEELDARTIAECQGQVDAITRDLLDYENVPETSRYRLENADLQTSLLLSNLGPFGLKGFFPYVQAASLRCITHWALYKSSGDLRELKNLLSTVDEATGRAEGLLAVFPLSYDFDTEEVPPVRIYCGNLGGRSMECTGWWYEINGAEHQSQVIARDERSAREFVERERRAYIVSLGEQFETTRFEVHEPMRRVIANWKSAAAAAKLLIAK